MDVSEDSEIDFPSDTDANDQFYENLLVQELEADDDVRRVLPNHATCSFVPPIQSDVQDADIEASGDFASVEEFAHILESAGTDEISGKQKQWEARFNKKGKTAAAGTFPVARCPVPDLTLTQ